MRVITKLMAVVAFVSGGLSATADEIDYSTWYQYKDGSVFGDAFYDPTDPGQTLVAAEAGKNYYVPANKSGQLPGPSQSSYAFLGSVLAVAKEVKGSNWGCTYTFPELRLLPGGQVGHGSHNTIAGTISVYGTVASPSKLSAFLYNSNTFKYPANVTGGADAMLLVAMSSESKNAKNKQFDRESILSSYFNMSGSWENYLGTVTVCTNTYFCWTSSSQILGGTLKVASGGFFGSNKKSGIVTTGGLELEPGSELLFQFGSSMSHPILTVTNSFTASGDFTLSCTGTAQTFWTSTYNKDIVLVRYTGPAANLDVDLTDARVNHPFNPVKLGPLPPNMRLAWKDNAEQQSKDLVITWDPVVLMTVGNDSYKPSGSAFYSTNSFYWSTGEIPGADFDGWVYCGDYNLTTLSTWDTFSIPKLRLVSGPSFRPHVAEVVFQDIYIPQNCELASYNGAMTCKISTPIHILNDKTLTFASRGGRRFEVASPIDGNGVITASSDTAGGCVTAKLSVGNPDFHGRVYMTHGNRVSDTGAVTTNFLQVTSGSALGGAYVGDVGWKSFHVAKAAEIQIIDDVDFNEPTRGLFVDGAANFKVSAGKTFTVANAITWGGEFYKYGTGALVLGGTPRYLADPAADPVDTPVALETNRLTIAEGTFAVASTNIVNGVPVTFAPGTCWVLDPAATGDGVTTYGAVNTLCNTPFAVTGGGAIPVKVKSGYAASGEFSVAICTVNSTAAQALSFAEAERFRPYRCTVEPRENDDGTVTFVANFSRAGLLLLVK